jgi:hypothetical protein
MQLKINTDIIITYSPIREHTGHIFEVFDYYIILKNYFNVKIILFTKLTINDINSCLLRYKEKYINDILDNLILINNYENYKIINCKNSIIIITDGNIKAFIENSIIFNCKKIICFMCKYDNNLKKYKDNLYYKNILYLQDYRIYDKNKYFNSIDYVKKINFDSYKEININNNLNNISLLYLTNNCRYLLNNDIEKIINKYNNKFNNFIIISPNNDLINNYFKNNKKVISYCPPIKENIFNLFNYYIYTPVSQKFDCSPRLITECRYYNKKVIYYNINYKDLGLKIRKRDIEEDFNNLFLNNDDVIIKILKEIL